MDEFFLTCQDTVQSGLKISQANTRDYKSDNWKEKEADAPGLTFMVWWHNMFSQENWES